MSLQRRLTKVQKQPAWLLILVIARLITNLLTIAGFTQGIAKHINDRYFWQHEEEEVINSIHAGSSIDYF